MPFDLDLPMAMRIAGMEEELEQTGQTFNESMHRLNQDLDNDFDWQLWFKKVLIIDTLEPG